MRLPFFLIVILCIVSACVEKYPAAIRVEVPKLVVDGTITTSKPPYRIQLSYSGVFDYAFQALGDKPVKDAQIKIKYSRKSTGFKYLGKGVYESTNLTFRGVVGQTYLLQIQLPNGRKFSSFPEKMPSPVAIQSIYGEFFKKSLYQTESVIVKDQRTIPPLYPSGPNIYAAEPDGPSGYQVFIDSQDPANENNYYRWTATSVTRRETTGRCDSLTLCLCNCVIGASCFVPRQHLDINTTSDALINGNPIKRKYVCYVPVFTTGNIYLEINQMTMTKAAYQFWKRYQEQLSRTGSILDPLPAPIEGNIYNLDNPSDLALGYFSAMGNFKKRHIIPVQLLDSYLLPQGVSRRRGTCLENYGSLGAYDTNQWPTPSWSTEDLN